MSDSDIVKDFLVESYENLDRLDRDLVGLEKNPQDRDALAGVFRTIHTIKGTCGFLGFSKLEKVAHVGENLLTRLRDGQLTLNPEITTALLGMVDAVRQMLKQIDSTGQDGDADYPELRETLTRLQISAAASVGLAAPSPPGRVDPMPQCLRMASSPLFGLAKPPESIKGAVISLGLRRVQSILLTCCLGQAFPTKNWPLDPVVFWRHSLGCAMVCRKFSEKLATADREKAYMAGLLHDIGLMVNCVAFSKEFAIAVERALQEQIPLDQAERATMGSTHCETGRALAEKWHLADDIIQVIAHHHAPEHSESAQPLVALVHLGDLLCRVRGLGYGYYERHKVDLIYDPAWAILAQQHRDLDGVDLVRFTFELDEAVGEVHDLVSTIFGSTAARN